jgi:hypothetical protein
MWPKGLLKAPRQQLPGLVWEDQNSAISFNLENGDRQAINIHHEETKATQAGDPGPHLTTPLPSGPGKDGKRAKPEHRTPRERGLHHLGHLARKMPSLIIQDSEKCAVHHASRTDTHTPPCRAARLWPSAHSPPCPS